MRRSGRTWRAEPSGASTWRELPVLLIDFPGATVVDEVKIEINDVGLGRLAAYGLVPELGALEPDRHFGANARRRSRDPDDPESQRLYATDAPTAPSFGHLADAVPVLGNFASQKRPDVILRELGRDVIQHRLHQLRRTARAAVSSRYGLQVQLRRLCPADNIGEGGRQHDRKGGRYPGCHGTRTGHAM